jgi:hypothetical protein
MNLTDNNKKLVMWGFPAALGFLSFILMAIDYIESFISVGSILDESQGYNGYKLLDMFEFEKYGSVISIVQIMVLVVSIFLLVIGALGILKEYKIINLPESVAEMPISYFSKLGMIVHTALNLILLVFTIILTVDYTEKNGFGTLGFRLSAGIFIMLIVSLGVTAVYVYLESKGFFSSDEASESVAAATEEEKESIETVEETADEAVFENNVEEIPEEESEEQESNNNEEV